MHPLTCNIFLASDPTVTPSNVDNAKYVELYPVRDPCDDYLDDDYFDNDYVDDLDERISESYWIKEHPYPTWKQVIGSMQMPTDAEVQFVERKYIEGE